MGTRTLVKTDELDIDGGRYIVKYFRTVTGRGTERYSSELSLGPDDRIIVDGSSLDDLECRVARMIPATVRSRMLSRPDLS